MKTFYWLNRNRLLSDLSIATAVWALVLVSAVVLITPSIAAAEETHNTVFSVMTRNMDLGSNYGPALTASDAASFAHGVTTIYNEIVASNIAERAAGIAREIEQTMPTVLGSQSRATVCLDRDPRAIPRPDRSTSSPPNRARPTWSFLFACH